MNVTDISGVEWCGPEDDGFTILQQQRLKGLCARRPHDYVWIGIGDFPDDFKIDHASGENIPAVQEAVAQLCLDYRVWMVQRGRHREEQDNYKGRPYPRSR